MPCQPAAAFDRQACMKEILLTPSVVFLLSACTTGEQMSRLDPGMTRQQVVGVLGRPMQSAVAVYTSSSSTRHILITGWLWDRSDFKVILKDGWVVEFGRQAKLEIGVPSRVHALRRAEPA